MSIYEYDEEKTMRMLREEAYEDGVQDGIQTGVQTGIQATIKAYLEFNASPELILQKLVSEFQISPEKAQTYLNDYLFPKTP